MDTSEAYAPINALGDEVILVSLCLLLLALAIAIVMVRQVLAPIEELTTVVSAISKGNMNTELNPKLKESEDEIGKLARAFDRTLVSLKLAMRETTPQLKIESKALKDALAEKTKAEARYRALVKTSPDAVIVTDPAGIISEISNRTLEVFGADRPSELIGTDSYALLPSEARDAARKLITSTLNTRWEMNGVKLTMQRKDGSRFTGEVNIKRVKDATGKHVGTILTLRDISKREAEEKALRDALAKVDIAAKELKEERDRVKGYLDIADVILVAIDADEKVTMVNRKGCEILGYSEGEIIGKNWFDTFIPKQARRRVEKGFSQLMEGKMENAEYFENGIVTKNGNERLIAWHNVLMKKDDRIIGTLSSGEDISELARLEERYKALVETTPAATTVIDLKGIVTEVSNQTVRIHGYRSAAEMIGMSAFDLIVPEEQERARDISIRTAKMGHYENIKYTMLRKDGSRFPAVLNVRVLRDPAGKIYGFIGTTTVLKTAKKTGKGVDA